MSASSASDDTESRLPIRGASYVLVVDDDRGIAGVLRATLTKGGYEVVVASDGRSALTRVAERRPAAIVLDLHMPGLSGWDVLQELHEQAADALVPVILISGDNRLRPAHPGSSLGVVATLRKPFRPTELLRVVNSALAVS